MSSYIGRFAPSPTGALHAGSLVAALASWLDARAHAGKWLVRIEDVDTPRCIPGAAAEILRQLAACGLTPDEAPVYQSQRSSLYQAALDQLIAAQAAYPCACSRKDIEAAISAQGALKTRHGELIYPGTCRHGLAGREARAWRLQTDFFKPNMLIAGVESAQSAHLSIANDASVIRWQDRRLNTQQQHLAAEVGDFILKRADGLWAYQLAVVVDDAAQGITHIVRGEDLADNTARQIYLQHALGYSTPLYLHTPLVLAADGNKLSKQNGAQALSLNSPQQALAALQSAATLLQLPQVQHTSIAQALHSWVQAWLVKYRLHE
ncbi:tRNA glutamyl-Q(34) synthetase GluQRS [Variovorax sp. PCZ-1]|uniref:tRNA glutamyl-Q(34) synthetase GluQRS n=1 Tax=Variovorax sp. PCZ-1 TaxID=2835533 RepID=UPI001BCAE554|nr:tRNA glutamyl-Q(34) synthetase GluQRS [Variovorax sp. PCZ-1]MBS7807561.1 tRNA glutamyl-Q(34) synthetase GluQRS [Variovorax sp. PCZ-1]